MAQRQVLPVLTSIILSLWIAMTQARFHARRTQRYHVVHNNYAALSKQVLPGCRWTSDNDHGNMWDTAHLLAMEAGRAEFSWVMANFAATWHWADASATSGGVARGS